MIGKPDTAATPACLKGAHHARGTGADHGNIYLM